MLLRRSFWVPACVLAVGILRGAEYSFTDLGTGSAVAINNSGVILLNDGGNAFRVQNGQRLQITNTVVFEWGDTIYLTAMSVRTLNDAGHFVGRLGGAFPHAFFSTGDGPIELVEDGFVMPELSGLNHADAYVGWYISDSIVYGAIGRRGQNPAWTVVEGLNYCQMTAINDAGVAVGFGAETHLGGGFPPPYRNTAYRARAFKLVNGTVNYLDQRSAGNVPAYYNATPSVRLSDALAINSTGAVVGNMAMVADGPKHAFRHVGNGMEDLGTLGGPYSQANDINDSGVIVGESEVVEGTLRAFIYRNGTMVDLNTLLPPGVNAVFTRASAINNQGQIVGEARIGDSLHAVLLSPDGLATPPQIIRQPVGAAVPLGGSVTLTVGATGDLPLSFQWEKGTVSLPDQTASTLALIDVKGFDSGSYRVVVKNAGGTAISEAATVTVLDPQLSAHTFAGLALVGEVGAKYRIEFRPAVNASEWQPLDTVELTTSPQWWVDMASATNPMRIYQAVRLPP